MGSRPWRKILRLAELNDMLESMGVSTADLVAVLKSRKAIRTVSSQGLYYIEMEDDEPYMRHVNERLLHDISHDLNNKLVMRWTDEPSPVFMDADGRPRENIRRISLDVLVSAEAAKQWDAE
jgi:hypothetical protein